MRSYDVATSAFALQMPRKWLDNLLSQHSVPGVPQTSRGVARSLSLESLALIAVVRDLQRELGVGIGSGLALATRLHRTPSVTELRDIPVAPGLRLLVNLADVQRRLDRRLIEAMEAVSPRTRGRPPGQPKQRSS